MVSQSNRSQVGTRRVLAAAVGMVLIVVIALILRRDKPAVVVAQAPPGSAIAPPMDLKPSPTAAPMASPSPEATATPAESPDAFSDDSNNRLPVATFHVRADLEGGCVFPPDAMVAFIQIMPGDQPAIVKRVPLADTGVDGGYKHFWQPDAIALSVCVETEVAAVPGATIPRELLDSLPAGEQIVPPLLAKEMLSPENALVKGPRAAGLIIDRSGVIQRSGRPSPETDETSITMRMIGACLGSIILELPADAPHSIIDDVELFSPRIQQLGVSHLQRHVEGLSQKLYAEGTGIPVQFEQVPGEMRIHPLYPGTYGIQLRTADSRIWTAEEVVLEPGGETRLRVELEEAAHITARVVGASSPSAEIRYRLGGMAHLGDDPLVASKIPKPPVARGLARDPRGVLRADMPMEFVAIPSGAYTVFATESGDRWGHEFVSIETGEHHEVVIDLGSLVDVTIDVVDQNGNPIQGEGQSVYVYSETTGSNVWRVELNKEGRGVEEFSPGTHRITYKGQDTRESSEIYATVVGKGDGDYFKMVVNKTTRLRGRVIDGANRPMEGVQIRAIIRPAMHWSQADTAAVSNQLGEFEIVVPEHLFLVEAKKNMAYQIVQVTPPLPEGEILEIKMESLSIRGVLLDRETGLPVAKHRVTCTQFADLKFEVTPYAEGLHFVKGQSETTAEDGTFVFTDRAAGTYMVRASGSGMDIRAGGKLVELKTADHPPVTIYTEGEAATLTGKIRDEMGRPIAKMELFAVHPVGEPPIRLVDSVYTDNEGRYEAKNLDPGEILTAIFVQASHDTQPRYFLAHLAEGITLREGETTTYDFVATSGARLIVSVATADGSPVRGAEIRLMQGGDEVIDQARLTPGPAMTDRNGRLMYRAIPPGTYTARATLADGRTIEGTVTLGVWENKTLTLRVE